MYRVDVIMVSDGRPKNQPTIIMVVVVKDLERERVKGISFNHGELQDLGKKGLRANNFGNVSKRQQSARRFCDNSEPYHGDCGIFVGGSTFGSSNVLRFLPDDRYDCLFCQSGSVETQGEFSSASARRNTSHCNDLPGLVGFSPTDQHSPFLSKYRGGPAILDFETSVDPNLRSIISL
nr:hypothetical protein [Tanacetum cinerariifolium]